VSLCVEVWRRHPAGLLVIQPGTPCCRDRVALPLRLLGFPLLAGEDVCSCAACHAPLANAGFPIRAVFDGPPGECLRPDRNKIFHGHGIHCLATYSAEPSNGAAPRSSEQRQHGNGHEVITWSVAVSTLLGASAGGTQ